MTRAILAYVGQATNSDGQETVNHRQHAAALRGYGNDFSRSLVEMLTAWEDYAKAHESRYDAKIGEDYVMGRYWAEAGLAIKRLLDGETGGLDCGSIAHNITTAIQAQGFATDGYNLTEAE